MLHSCGMKAPNLSKREALSAIEIDSALCKAHGIAPIHEIDSEEDIQQIDAGPVWHGLALDLLLGNLEQQFWGWADPQAIFLLDYWKTLDPKMTFVLVYDEPHRVLSEAVFDDARLLSGESVSHQLKNWHAYNSILQRFHLLNHERSLLVNARQACDTADTYLNELQVYLDDPLSLPAQSLSNGSFRVAASIENSHNGKARQTSEACAVETTDSVDPMPIDSFLIQGILAEHPQYTQLYEELQSTANLPRAASSRSYAEPLDAWLSYMKIRFDTGRVLSLHHEARNQAEQAAISQEEEPGKARMQVGEMKGKYKVNSRELPNHSFGTSKYPEKFESELKEIKEENELLLLQLHQVQEELERYYVENFTLRGKGVGTVQKKALHFGAADRIRQQLSYRLGAVMVERSHSLSGWLGMPFALVKERRAFRQESTVKPLNKLPPIHAYQDAQEAEKVKKHLSYRLGSAMVQHGSSPAGWLKLPFLLYREVTAFRTERSGK